PISPVEPMYIAGRRRTASSPPRTLIDFASYLWPPCGVPLTFSLSPMFSPGPATSRVYPQRWTDSAQFGVRVRAQKLIMCEARKAYLRNFPCVALPFDSGFAGQNPELVGFLL